MPDDNPVQIREYAAAGWGAARAKKILEGTG
jgi:hypothetical protein